MYSVVLMVALTSGDSTPSFFHHKPVVSTHASTSCPTCLGVGAMPMGGFPGYGCYGYGGTSMAGNGFGACYGCCGGGGCIGGVAISQGLGGYGTPQTWIPGSPTLPAPMNPGIENKEPEKQKVEPMEKEEKERTSRLTSAPATVIVDVPAHAMLFVENQPTKTTSATRTFTTPHLDVNETFRYTIRVEMKVDGKTHSRSKQIIVRGGQVTRTSFDDPQQALSAVNP